MQEDVTVEGGGVIVPPGLKRGANRRLAGEDVAAGRGRAAGRHACSRPQHVALAAALGLTELDGAAAAAGRDLLDRRRGGRARRAARRAPRSTTPTAICCANCWSGWARPSPISASCRTIRRRWRARSPRPPRGTISSLTSGGVSTGEADHVRGAVERIGRLVFWRVAIKPGRPVAMGVIRGAERRQRRLRRPAGQSGGGVRDLRAGGAAVAAAARRRARRSR